MIKHLGVFTSGGDAPGMNAALFGVLQAAYKFGIKVSGFKRGFEGMIDGDIISLTLEQVKANVHLGGTLLKTARSERFRTLAGRKKALTTLKNNAIDGLIAIGGDGTFKGLLALSEISTIPCIGIPGTIDNDLRGSDFTLGFDTALNTAVENIDKIRDTAESHNRIFLVEVMGRDAGYIAVYTGLSSAVDAILIPESLRDFPSLIKKISHFKGNRAFIVVVAEGDEIGTEELAIETQKIHPKTELRVCRIGHVQRGGSPSVFDRMLGLRLGYGAVDKIIKGKKGQMIGTFNNQLKLTPFQEVIQQQKMDEDIEKLVEIMNHPQQLTQ